MIQSHNIKIKGHKSSCVPGLYPVGSTSSPTLSHFSASGGGKCDSKRETNCRRSIARRHGENSESDRDNSDLVVAFDEKLFFLSSTNDLIGRR